MNKEQRIVWIDQYLKGALSNEERARFEEQYRNERDFAKAIDLQKELGAILADQEVLALNRQVESVIEQLESRAEAGAAPILSSRPVINWWIWVGAGLISFLLALSALWYFRQQNELQKKDVIALIDQFMQEETGLSDSQGSVSRTARPSAEESSAPLSENTAAQLELLYHFSGKALLEEHLSILNTMDSLYRLDSAAVQARRPDFFLTHGLHNLYAGRTKEALSDFELARPAHPERVEWYRALAFLKTPGKRSEAVQILQSIAFRKHQYRKQAEALLKVISNE